MKTSEIDFSCITLRSLRAMLPSTDGVETPSEIWFRENPDEILFYDFCGDGIVTVYTNGFYTYTEDKGEHLSVLRVDGFDRLRYDFADSSKAVINEEEYLDSSYLIGLYINGQNQWLRNAERRTSYYHGFYLDEDEWNESIAVPSAEEETLKLEEEQETRSLIGQALEELTKRQREIIRMYFYDGLTQERIAKLTGLSRRTIREHLHYAIKKIRNFFPEHTAIDPLFFRAY